MTFIHMVQTAFPEERGKIKISQAGNKGFTLLELIIVILIVGFSAAIAIVSVGKAYDKRIFNDAAKKVFITLSHAREVAIIEKTPLFFKTDKKNNIFWLEKEGSVYGSIQHLPERVSISGEPIRFSPKGDSSGGRVSIKNEDGREYSIEVDPVLGAPKIKGP